MQVLFSCKEKVFDEWLETFPDLASDSLQPIFQYYMADRKEKMQDYTPKTLAKACILLAGVEKAKSVYDMCAGSGALTIQAWNVNKNCSFVCEELDEKVIPFLMFNLSIRNMDAVIINGDILSGERFKAWRLRKGQKYSEIEEIKPPAKINADCCISNPPYNLKWVHEPLMGLDERFAQFGVPPKSNANYAFVLTALNNANRSCLILPNNVLESTLKDELEIRRNIVNDNKIESVILCPEKMFEATGISTCLLCLDNTKTTANIELIDMRKTCQEEQREQRGQFGGKSHTNRVYSKTVNIFTDEHIKQMLEAVEKRSNETEFSKSVSLEDVKSQKYRLSPAVYMDLVEQEIKHREYADILADLNKVRTERNSCKLIINETVAKRLGFDTQMYKKDCLQDGDFSSLMQKLAGGKAVKSDYISFTKNKGELTFKNNNPDVLSSVLIMIMQMWKQHIYYLNEQENIYLCEMRDALLPDLMSGKIEV